MGVPGRYQEWLDYLFQHDVPTGQQLEWYFESDAPQFTVESEELAELWCCMFENCGHGFSQYTDDQIGMGLWYLFSGSCSDLVNKISEPSLSIDIRVKCYQSLYYLYQDCFRQRCNPMLGHLSEGKTRLDCFCYMLWDISPLGWLPDGAESDIENALFDLLARALQIDHPACVESALHGLGHLALTYPMRADAIITSFLDNASPSTRPKLIEYAHKARLGEIL